MDAFFDYLVNTPYSEWVRESWGWPIALTFHAFGNAAVAGLMFLIGMRLFGLFQSIPYSSLLRLFPIIWIAFGVQVVSGTTLWMTKPARYIGDGVFDIKFTLVVVGAVLTYFFQKMLKREAAAWDAAGTVSAKGRRFAGLAILVWAFVIIMGRLTAYLGQLYTT